jgi:biopolymer transport protein ExbD
MSGGDRRATDHGDVPWPALVDLLTSVLITFMFFVLVTTVAMSTMTMKSAQRAAQKQQAEIQKTPQTPDTSKDNQGELMLTPEEVQKLTQRIHKLEEENEDLKKRIITMSSSSFTKSKTIETQSDVPGKTFLFFFNRNEAGITPESQSKLAVFMANIRKSQPNARITLTAAQPQDMGNTRGREMALTRAMVIRNTLLDMNIPADRITFHYQEGSQVLNKSQDWLKLQITPSGDSSQ